MAAFTPNYGLHQWEPEDQFLRMDFNEDFSKIDSALRGLQTGINGKSSFACGVYTGTAGTQSIALGFRPRAVVLCYINRTVLVTSSFSGGFLTFTNTGFTVVDSVSGTYFKPNERNEIYYYLALK